MNILQLCNKVPFPPKDGGCIAMNALTQGLIKEGNKVKILAINTKKHFVDVTELPDDYRLSTRIEAVFVDTEIKVTDAFLNLFSNKSYNVERFYSVEFENKLIAVLQAESFDIIQLESLYVSMYVSTIRKYSTAKIVLRAHNVEHLLWERNAQLASNPLKKAYLKLLAKRLKNYEVNSLSGLDAIVTITKVDALYFKNAGYLKPLITAPFGIDLNGSEVTTIAEEFPSVFHIGAMDWQPNIEGVNWFLINVWDKVIREHPELKLYLAGRSMNTGDLEKLNKPNVIIVGEVENAKKFICSKGIMIVPLLSGGGMRVKIIEGLSLGKTIITTTIGIEGIECGNNKNCIVANTPNEFVAAISKCINDKSFYMSVGKNAKLLAFEHFNNVDN
jgi:glycosyltransferase involved in cell wall biosynthesis